MSTAFDHLNGDHMLLDSCSWQAFAGQSESAALDDSANYANAETLACNINTPSRRWQSQGWPMTEITGAMEFVLAAGSTVAVRDQLTYDGLRYRVIDVNNWAGAGRVVLAERTEGAT